MPTGQLIQVFLHYHSFPAILRSVTLTVKLNNILKYKLYLYLKNIKDIIVTFI